MNSLEHTLADLLLVELDGQEIREKVTFVTNTKIKQEKNKENKTNLQRKERMKQTKRTNSTRNGLPKNTMSQDTCKWLESEYSV